MRRIICVIVTLIGLLGGVRADGLASSLIRTSGTPSLGTGTFYGYRAYDEGPGDTAFSLCLDLARTQHVPLVVIWSNAGCTHCEGFANQLNVDTDLPAWLKNTHALFAYFKGTGGTQHPMDEHGPAACKAAYDFTVSCGAPVGKMPWPFYAIYYPKEDGTTASTAGSLAGSNWASGQYASLTADDFKGLVEDFLAENPETPVAGDATFVNADLPEARLEAMPSTVAVYVPLVCTAALEAPVTNRLTIVYPNGAKSVSNVVWQVGNGSQEQEVRVPTAGLGTTGDEIRLQLRNELGVLNAVSAIHYVDEITNAQRFPYFYGEKTVAELNWGEWTMDLDVATNCVAAAVAKGEKAYTLLAVGGALWCPNCTNIEEYIYNQPKFTAWAKEHHVALVTYDQPMNGLTAPTLLTHDLYAKSGRSGSYYLSRKGLTVAEGRAQFDRVYALSHTRWPEGFLVEPTAMRIANPVLILLRPDGTPGGRFTSQRVKTGGSTSTEPYDLDENLARLTEFLALADDASAEGKTEETNNKPGTTPLVHRYGSEDGFKLQVNDRADVFRLQDMPTGVPVRFVVTAAASAKSDVTVRVLIATNGTGSSTLTRPLPTVAENVWKFTAAELDAGAYVELSAYADARYPTYGGGTAFSGSFVTQEVPPDPGVVGFTVTDLDVVEGEETAARLEVCRTRGASGAVKVRIDRIDDPLLTTADPARYVWDPTDLAGHTLVWQETELAVRTLVVPVVDDTVSDGSQTVAFELKVIDDSGATLGISTNFVHLIEDDQPTVGRLAITDTDPVGLDRRNVQAIEGTTLSFEVSRLEGSTGSVGADIVTSSSAAQLSTNRLVWLDCNRNIGRRAEQVVTVTVPRLEDLGRSGCFTVTLKPDKGVPYEAAALTFAVWVLPEEGAFAYGRTEEISVVQREGVLVSVSPAAVPAGNLVYSLEAANGLPDGVTASVDAESGVVTVSGVVKDEASGEGIVQVKGVDGEGNVVWGLPVRLTFSVTSLAEAVPSFAESRSFTCVPLFGKDSATISGTVDVALPTSGRASVRYRGCCGVASSFKIDAWSFNRETGDFTGESERSGRTVRVTVTQTGDVSVGIVDPAVGDAELTAVPPVGAEVWSESNPAARWQGLYTVACPAIRSEGTPSYSGTPVLSVNLDTETAKYAGMAKVAGVLPDGRTFSGAVPLVRNAEAAFATLTVFSGAAAADFGAVLRVLPDGEEQAGVSRQRVFSEDGTLAFWRLRKDGATYGRAYGSWYDPDENWETRWQSDYLSNRQNVWVGDDVIGSLVAHTVDVTVDDSTAAAFGLTFALNRSTGVCSGTFERGDVRYRWRGVFLPGWAESCGDCGTEGGEEGVVLPFALGSCWTESSPRVGSELTIGDEGRED